MFYVDVMPDSDFNFYYNMAEEVNDQVEKVVKNWIANRPISAAAQAYSNRFKAKRGRMAKAYDAPKLFGMMAHTNMYSGQIEYDSVLDMAGILGTVSDVLAQDVLDRAIYYCPKDTGYLASTGRIESLGTGKSQIIFDCEYAWYVHEFSWVSHTYPTRHHFLTQAIYEVEKLAGYGWY